MSAVSKKLIPASRAALRTAAVRSASNRPPKLLHPSPTTETSSDPIRLFSIAPPHSRAPYRFLPRTVLRRRYRQLLRLRRRRSEGQVFVLRGRPSGGHGQVGDLGQ